ncbi:MAG: hypothetical protein HYT75_05890, partial [Deltaproteobacteria bacterium]|nr:hypothetical protein [Deltaproteobacteria bacterium]
MKKPALYFLIAVFCCALSFNSAATTKKSAKIVPSQQKTAATGHKKKRVRRLKYVSPSKEELTAENIPLALPTPDEAIKALSASDLDEAIRVLRPEPPSSRSLYLLREIQRIVLYNKNKKAPKLDRHQFYQNIGVAYHNLFLFLKKHEITNENFYKMAIKFYKK